MQQVESLNNPNGLQNEKGFNKLSEFILKYYF